MIAAATKFIFAYIIKYHLTIVTKYYNFALDFTLNNYNDR